MKSTKKVTARLILSQAVEMLTWGYVQGEYLEIVDESLKKEMRKGGYPYSSYGEAMWELAKKTLTPRQVKNLTKAGKIKVCAIGAVQLMSSFNAEKKPNAGLYRQVLNDPEYHKTLVALAIAIKPSSVIHEFDFYLENEGSYRSGRFYDELQELIINFNDSHSLLMGGGNTDGGGEEQDKKRVIAAFEFALAIMDSKRGRKQVEWIVNNLLR